MKYTRIQSLLLLVLIAFVFSSCEKEEYEIGEPFSSLKGINTTWTIDQVWQVDNTQTGSDNSLDVSRFFRTASPLKITFNTDDFSFVVDAGDSPNYLGTAGSWSFDDDEFPSLITLDENGVEKILTMNAPVRENVDQVLDITMNRPACDGEDAVSYRYMFVREN